MNVDERRFNQQVNSNFNSSSIKFFPSIKCLKKCLVLTNWYQKLIQIDTKTIPVLYYGINVLCVILKGGCRPVVIIESRLLVDTDLLLISASDYYKPTHEANRCWVWNDKWLLPWVYFYLLSHIGNNDYDAILSTAVVSRLWDMRNMSMCSMSLQFTSFSAPLHCHYTVYAHTHAHTQTSGEDLV